MTTPPNNHLPSQHDTLRNTATYELDSGNLEINSGWTLPTETLALLYKLSSDPDSAPDALKLLHELQTHQVELELQYRQLLTNEQFIKHQLSKFKSLLDLSAIGYIMTDADGHIIEINTAGSSLLSIDNDAAIGESVNQFFGAHAQARLRQLFKQLEDENDDADVACIQSSPSDSGTERQLKITASISVADNAVLMTIMEQKTSQPH